MIPELKIYKPKNIDEALVLLNEHNSDIKIIAGGTDVVPGMQQGSVRFKNFSSLMDTGNIHDLQKIELCDNKICIGAGVTFSDLNRNKLVKKYFTLLAESAGKVGSKQIRNLATVGGNIVNNAPCADSVPPLLVYDAQIKIRSTKSERIIKLEEFLIKPYKTELQPGEIVTEIILPIIDDNYLGEFYKLGRRRAVSISRITLAVLLKCAKGTITDLKIASGAVSPIGKRIYKVEEYAKGKTISEELLKELATMLGREILGKTGLRWSSPYKLPVIQQMFYQLLFNLSFQCKVRQN